MTFSNCVHEPLSNTTNCPAPPPAHITFVGDSITWGHGIRQAQDRWTTIVATHLQAPERNLGISATTMQSGAPRHHVSQSGQEIIAKLPPKPPQQKAYLIISYGFNDIRYQSPQFSPQAYLWTMLQSIEVARQKGYQSQEIVIASPYWFNPAVFEPQYQRPQNFPWNATTRNRQQNYRQAAQIASWLGGTRYVDSFAATIGSPTVDQIHPNEIGHRAIAQATLKTLCPIKWSQRINNTWQNLLHFIKEWFEPLGVGLDSKH
jgi:lysophospholipase L1-like esterase